MLIVAKRGGKYGYINGLGKIKVPLFMIIIANHGLGLIRLPITLMRFAKTGNGALLIRVHRKGRLLCRLNIKTLAVSFWHGLGK